MTLSVLLAVHVAYGALLAFTTWPRMRSEGEVLGWPLVLTLSPVVLGSFPLSSVMLRYAGGWFLHGLFLGDSRITFERFHLGLMFGVGVLLVLATLLGNFFVIAFLSREKESTAYAPFGLAAIAVIVVAIWQGSALYTVQGTSGRFVWQHPVGLVSVAILAFLFAGWWTGRRKLSAPLEPGPGIGIG